MNHHRLFPKRRLLLIAIGWLCMLTAAARGSELLERVEEARKQFKPPSRQEMRAAAQEVRTAMSAIEAYVGRSGQATLTSWKKYLKWDEQTAQLTGKTTFDPAMWRGLLRRERVDWPGLERQPFQAHRAAVEKLLIAVEGAVNANLQKEFEQTLTELASALRQAGKAPSLEQLEKINSLCTRLHRQGQAEQLVRAVRSQYARTNFEVSIPAGLIDKLSSDGWTRDYRVNDVINGASVEGSGRMKGTQKFAVLPDSKKGLIEIAIKGTSDSTTRSYRDRVTVNTDNSLSFNSRSEAHIDAEGLRLQPFRTNADLTSRITGINTSRGGRRDAVARQEVHSRRETDRREAQRRAVEQLNRNFHRELSDRIKPIRDSFNTHIRNPLLCRDRFPEETWVTSDPSGLRFRAIAAADYQMGAQSPPPSFGKADEIKVAVHQSALNNTGSAFLAGRTMSFRKALQQLLTITANSGEPAAEAEPLLATFTESAPLHVSFTKGEVRFELSGSAFKQGASTYSGMNAVLTFRPQRKDGQWWLVKSKPPEVLLPRLPDGTRPRLGIRDYAFRRILINVINRDVPERSRLKAFALPASFDAGQLAAPSVVKIGDGWFCLAAKMEDTGKTPKASNR